MGSDIESPSITRPVRILLTHTTNDEDTQGQHEEKVDEGEEDEDEEEDEIEQSDTDVHIDGGSENDHIHTQVTIADHGNEVAMREEMYFSEDDEGVAAASATTPASTSAPLAAHADESNAGLVETESPSLCPNSPSRYHFVEGEDEDTFRIQHEPLSMDEEEESDEQTHQHQS